MLLADAATSASGAFHSECLFQDIDSAQHLLLKGIIIGGGGHKPQPFFVYAILYGVLLFFADEHHHELSAYRGLLY
ncbi:MAG: hypothetical protein U5L09_17760 [Bacteroidales bacterium]|nr:hypothetical protein [Bacteroidales bacterium]